MKKNILKIKKIAESEIVVTIQVNTEKLHIVYNLQYGTPKNIYVVFYNGSNNDYHFITTEPEFEDYNYSGKNIEK